MSELVVNYVVHPFSGLGEKFSRFFQVVGYSRAASELARLGYHEEAKNCIDMIKTLQAETNENLEGWV